MSKKKPTFVAIGASAGGLEAISLLVQNLPRTAGAVYVVAQHMSPSHKSLLTSLLARGTTLTVVEIEDGMTPELDTIHITPPNTDVIVENGTLRLVPTSGHAASPKPSADRLFKSLAEEEGENCVAVVLSGTGSDGSYGVQAVREAGGITIAQDPTSAKYDGMPNSAAETGCIDLTLTPDQIGLHLERILARPRDFESLRDLTEQPNRLTDLLHILLARTRVDFRDYKENTVNRRIGRRMAALGISDYEKYVAYCRTSPKEVDALHRDLLISVTRFFRDPEQYNQLEKAIRNLVDTVEHRPFRIWVPGVATGEEAYSIAILFAEALGGPDTLRRNQVQIFATDIDTRALERARSGVYPLTALNDIPERFREGYFRQIKDRIEVSSDLRSSILFSEHNVFQDPPFLNLDLVSIRNVLIYFNTSLQEKVLKRIHYALTETGIMFLGTSETATVLDAFFERFRESDKVLAKRKLARAEAQSMRPSSFPVPSSGYRTIAPGPAQNQSSPQGNALFESLLSAVVKHGFLTTRSGEILRVIGDVSNYISLNANTALRMNTRILKAGLRDEAGNLIAISQRSSEQRRGNWIDLDAAKSLQVRLVCFPMQMDGTGEPTFLLSIEEREHEFESGRDVEALSEADRIKYLREVEREMLSMREALQQTVEELQTSNEELQSSNEELQSTNEELQATNEELETANEELQSTNEELITVNEELQVYSASLDRLSVELRATFDATLAPMLMVDDGLHIRHASRGALHFLSLETLPAEGVHLSQCVLPEGLPSATQISVEALQMREPRTATLATLDRITQVSAVPFDKTRSDSRGLTISIKEVDLSAMNQMMQMMDSLGEISHFMVDVASQRLHWSQNVFKIHGLTPSETMPTVEEAIRYYHPDDRQMVEDAVNGALTNGEDFKFDARLIRSDTQETVRIRSIGTVIRDDAGAPIKLIGVFRDISDQIENQILVEHFADVHDRFQIGFYSYDIETEKAFWSQGLYTLFGVDPEKQSASLPHSLDVIVDDDRERVSQLLDAAIKSGEAFEYDAHIKRANGKPVRCRAFGTVRLDGSGTPTHLYGSLQLLEDVKAG